ncbi:MAG TPA: ABC transporter substrate-binding protein [Solirubrobacterales bacterium]|nr:ABC transporter substrate-binding protein [Solirubrobacterales bacterium]
MSESGYFSDVGLSVFTLSPVTPALSIPDVVNGADALAVAHGPEAVMARDRGAPIRIVGALVSQPTAGLIWLRNTKIESIADLKGKTIAIPGLSFQEEFLRIALAHEGLTLGDVEVLKVGNDLVPALVSGRADAIFGGSFNVEGVELESRGLEPVGLTVEDVDIPEYDELVLVARADVIAKEPDLIRDFMSALAEGTGAALKDPEGGAKALDASVESTPKWGYKLTLAGVEETLPLLSESGYTDPAKLGRLVDWMFEKGMIQSDLEISELLTNDFAAEEP